FWHWYSSADGSRLIYDLLMVTPGEGEPQVLVADVAYPIGDINTPTKPPVWSADGRFIAYTESFGNTYVVEVATGTKTVLSSQNRESVAWQPG
ncbi:MAG: hypothetical protein JNJ61_11140, partial [Anaerolineae bacterium]|nr:hypothetical protein [Anaerolineae bacterium]